MAHYSARVRQGYLSRDKERVVRIRIKGEHGYITVKGPNHGDTRIEFEYMIPIEDAEKMLEICEGKIIDKTRYLVPTKDTIGKWTNSTETLRDSS